MFAGGRRAVLASVFTLSACAQLLSLDEYELPSSTTSSAITAGGAGAGDGGSSGQNSGGAGLGGAGGAIDCVLLAECSVPVPPIDGACPMECDNCIGGVCYLTCGTSKMCTGTFTCPPGFVCEVLCESLGCSAFRVECPKDHLCEVTCNWGDSCLGVDVACNNGPCELWCVGEPSSCDTVDLICGCNSCTVGCETGVPITGNEPNVTCEPSCDCKPICEPP